MTLPCLDQFAVSIVFDLAISVDVVPEVTRGDVTLIGCDAIGVRLIDEPAAIHITRKEAKRNIAMPDFQGNTSQHLYPTSANLERAAQVAGDKLWMAHRAASLANSAAVAREGRWFVCRRVRRWLPYFCKNKYAARLKSLHGVFANQLFVRPDQASSASCFRADKKNRVEICSTRPGSNRRPSLGQTERG